MERCSVDTRERPNQDRTMYATIVGSWLVASLVLWADFANSLPLLVSGFDKIAVGTITILIDLGWLYGFYHIGILTFTLLSSRTKLDNEPAVHSHPTSYPIAIFHTVCDDFQADAAGSCVSQEYSDFYVYLLDDSSSDEGKRSVDAFASRYKDLVTVIRREDRRGFKAGNINNALAQISTRYKYLALTDSDTFLPREYLSETSHLLNSSYPAAFVQALHTANLTGKNKLSQDLGEVVRVGWNYYQIVRNKFGFPMCYGHGALVRIDLLRAVGGFPEIVSEDIALTLRLRRLGFRGFFTSNVICGEDYPGDYHTFRKRLSRWISADLECLREELLPFLSTESISRTEKLDAAFRGLKVPLSAVFLPFSAGMSLALALLPNLDRFFDPMTIGVTLLAALAPYYCFMVDMIRHPKKLFSILSHLTAIYISNSLLFTIRTIEALAFRKSYFHVTGMKYQKVRIEGLSREILSADECGYPRFGVIEVFIGLLLITLGIHETNLVLIGISTALIFAPVFYSWGWENRMVSLLSHVPFILIILGIFGAFVLGQSSPTQCLALACLSILLF